MAGNADENDDRENKLQKKFIKLKQSNVDVELIFVTSKLA